MHKFISYNQQIILPVEAMFPAISSASLYGKGVFTTIAVYSGNLFLWNEHWTRLQKHASKIGLDFAEFDESSVKTALLKLIVQNNVTDGRARLTFFDQSSSRIWSFENSSQDKTGLLITTADFRQTSADILNLTVSTFRTNTKSPLSGLKTCNYLENTLAFEEAAKRGFDEAIRLNERDEIVSATMANVFWIKNDEIFTPTLETGALEGTTRNFVIKLAKELGIKYFESIFHIDNLANADEIFLTSAGIGIAEGAFFIKQTVSKESGSEVIANLKRAFAVKIKNGEEETARFQNSLGNFYKIWE